MSNLVGRRTINFLKDGRTTVILRRLQFSTANGKPTRIPNDQFLQSGKVKFETLKGKTVEVNAVWQDSMPSSSSMGTVVTLHGSPGSHNDFKYVEVLLRKKNIRVIGINQPGWGYTEHHDDIGFCNDDRDRYITAMIDHLNLDNIVWLGHSRGNENAMRLVARHASRSKGVAFANATGYRPHKGIRPLFLLPLIKAMYNSHPLVAKMMNPTIKFAYSKLGLAVESGEVGSRCVATMTTFSLEDIRKDVEEFNKSKHLQAFHCYAGNDFLIDRDISEEFADSFEDSERKLVESTKEAEEDATKWAVDRITSGHRMTSVGFKDDGHFLQKFRATIIAEAIGAMFRKV